MDTMYFYFGIEDFEPRKCSFPKKKEENREMSVVENFNFRF